MTNNPTKQHNVLSYLSDRQHRRTESHHLLRYWNG